MNPIQNKKKSESCSAGKDCDEGKGKGCCGKPSASPTSRMRAMPWDKRAKASAASPAKKC